MSDNTAPLLLDVSRMVGRRWHGLRPTGIDRICIAWQQHFGARAQATLFHKHGWHILPMKASQTLFALLEKDSTKAAFRLRFAAWAAQNLWNLAKARPGLGRIFLNAGHTGLNLPNLVNWVSQADIRPVVLLHDIIPITHPQFCRDGESERHEVRIRNMLKIAAGIVANSKDTLENLSRFADKAKLAVPPAVSIWPGTQRLEGLEQAPAGPADEFVILGTIEGRKNHLLLLNVWEKLVARFGPAAPKLVIVGRRGWACDEALSRLDAGGFMGRVEEAGPLDDFALAQRLANARALLFPSFVEGFGLPLVEALGAGVPVIASDLAVFKEIGQGVPQLLPASDEAQWIETILAYSAPDSPPRNVQLVRLESFRAPAWSQHFEAVEAFLEQI